MNSTEGGADSRPDGESVKLVVSDTTNDQAREVAFTPPEPRRDISEEDMADAAEAQVLPPKDSANTLSPETAIAASPPHPTPATTAVAATVSHKESKGDSSPVESPEPQRPTQVAKPVAAAGARHGSERPKLRLLKFDETTGSSTVFEPTKRPPEKATGSGSGGSGITDASQSGFSEDDDKPKEEELEHRAELPEKPTKTEVEKQPAKSGPYDEDRLIYNTVDRVRPKISPTLAESLTEQRKIVHETERPKSPEQVAEIEEVNAAVGELAKDVGVDITSRLPAPDVHHVFSTREDYKAAVASMNGSDEQIEAFACSLPQGIYRGPQMDEASEMAVITHETLHEVSIHFVDINVIHTGRNSRRLEFVLNAGFELPHAAMKEFVTDIAMLDALQRMGRPDPSSFTMLDAVGCALIERAAEFHSITPKELYHQLLKDMLTGTSQGVMLFAQGVGQESFMKFIELEGEETQEEFQKIAGELGLDELQDELRTTHLPGFRAPWEKMKSRARL